MGKLVGQASNSSWYSLQLFLCLLLLSISGQVIRAQSSTLVSVVPSMTTLEPGVSTRVTVQIEEAANVYGVEIHLRFDSSTIQVVDADESTEGVQLVSGDFLPESQGFLLANQVDNDAGRLLYALTLLAPAEPAAGTGTLIAFEVQSVSEGSSTLSLESVILASPEGSALPATVQDGQIIVSSGQATDLLVLGSSTIQLPTAVHTVKPPATATSTELPAPTDVPPSTIASPSDRRTGSTELPVPTDVSPAVRNSTTSPTGEPKPLQSVSVGSTSLPELTTASVTLTDLPPSVAVSPESMMSTQGEETEATGSSGSTETAGSTATATRPPTTELAAAIGENMSPAAPTRPSATSGRGEEGGQIGILILLIAAVMTFFAIALIFLRRALS